MVISYDKSWSGVPPHLIREEPYTYDEYADLPEDGNRYEVGRLIRLDDSITHRFAACESGC
jgi:hypothetical protein